jgi:hypothetical protein
MFNKRIVCLAISRKMQGKCIAGKDIDNNEWVRPISGTEHGELREDDIKYDNGQCPELLDIIDISFEKNKPLFCQPENVLISNEKWKKRGVFPKEKLDTLCDHPPSIWRNDSRNDRISEEYLKGHHADSSLLLIKLKSIRIERRDFIEASESIKKSVRAEFVYNQTTYNLGITDPDFEKIYISRAKGFYDIDAGKIYLCLSLGIPCPYDHYCYKLIAAIIRV